jgi:hypothetical protein
MCSGVMRAAFAVLAAAAFIAAAQATTSPTKTACPAASLLDSTLGVSVKSPTSTTYSVYSKTCSYAGTTGQIPIRVTFQTDTPATFATSEKAVKNLGVVNVKGLGQAAWTLKSGGDLYVYNNGVTLKIVAPLITSPKLEALAKKIL